MKIMKTKVYYDKYSEAYYSVEGLKRILENMIYSLECGVFGDVELKIHEIELLTENQVPDFRGNKKYMVKEEASDNGKNS